MANKTLLTFTERFNGPLAGELEFIFKDRNGRVLNVIRDHNVVKIFAKEILSHRLVPPRIWDPNASNGIGDWVDAGLTDEFSPRYFLFGAAFDANNQPLDGADPRYYNFDPVSGTYLPLRLGVGADYQGGLINAIPIADPTRPLKRIERVYFEPSYQPAGTPLLQADVRAINNTVVFETVLEIDEYNGFGLTSSDYFTVTEVALAAGIELGPIGACGCDPHDLFLIGSGSENTALLARATGTATITLDPSENANVDIIAEGDQVKITEAGASDNDPNILNQVTPFYLVLSKVIGGSDMVLDRIPVDQNNVPLHGTIGVFRDGLRLFSHRILSTPFKKSDVFEVTCRWKIIFG